MIALCHVALAAATPGTEILSLTYAGAWRFQYFDHVKTASAVQTRAIART